MSKRGETKFARNANDAYDTPPEVVQALLPYLPAGVEFHEPCAGAYALAGELEKHGHSCLTASDIAPRSPFVEKLEAQYVCPVGEDEEWVITNPPFEWSMLEPLLWTWTGDCGFHKVVLLLPLDMLANQRFAPYCGAIERVIMVGRVRWFPESSAKSMENFAWVIFGDEFCDDPIVGQVAA